ncbi:MAG: MFS transporter [Actinomycetota bacterium]
MRHRRPLGLRHVPADSGVPLARLAGLEGFARALMVGTVPLAALDALGSKQAVSIVFMIGSALTVFVTLNLARIEQVLPRRWVVTVGIGALIVAAALFAWGPAWAIPIAVGLRSAEASIFSVCLSLYMMDFIGKAELTKAESRRSVWLAVTWVIGPMAGTWLWSAWWPDAPFVATIVAAVALIAMHWWLRFLQNPVLRGPIVPAPSPIRSIPRFFGQPNLRIAYAVMCLRSIFWATVFVFGPIYVVEAGLPEWVAGAFLSVAASVLFMGPLVRRAADRWGVRFLVLRAFGLMGASMAVLFTLGEPRPLGIVFWLSGALGGGVIDVLGNIPFMRLVKPRERAAMTAVFSTWREVSFLVAPALAALVLAFAPFHVLYLVIALLMGIGVAVTTLLPRRLGQRPRARQEARVDRLADEGLVPAC